MDQKLPFEASRTWLASTKRGVGKVSFYFFRAQRQISYYDGSKGIKTSDTELVKFGGANNCTNALDLGSHQANHSSPDFKVVKIRSFVKKFATIPTFANKPAANT